MPGADIPSLPRSLVGHVQPATRIYFEGCEGSGKTSLARKVSAQYGLPFLTEVASAVLYEFQQRVGERASVRRRESDATTSSL